MDKIESHNLWYLSIKNVIALDRNILDGDQDTPMVTYRYEMAYNKLILIYCNINIVKRVWTQKYLFCV